MRSDYSAPIIEERAQRQQQIRRPAQRLHVPQRIVPVSFCRHCIAIQQSRRLETPVIRPCVLVRQPVKARPAGIGHRLHRPEADGLVHVAQVMRKARGQAQGIQLKPVFPESERKRIRLAPQLGVNRRGGLFRIRVIAQFQCASQPGRDHRKPFPVVATHRTPIAQCRRPCGNSFQRPTAHLQRKVDQRPQ